MTKEQKIAKERPILFSGEMVRAILEGRKIKTRRTGGLDEINERPDDFEFRRFVKFYEKTEILKAVFFDKVNNAEIFVKCPYGTPYSRLWLRETYEAWDDGIAYKATNPECNPVAKWKSALFMPRRYSRITLEITNIRVERLRDIREPDAIAEGIEEQPIERYRKYGLHRRYKNYAPNAEVFMDGDQVIGGYSCAIDSFKSLWESIKGEGSWQKNPWVWVIEFKRV